MPHQSWGCRVIFVGVDIDKRVHTAAAGRRRLLPAAEPRARLPAVDRRARSAQASPPEIRTRLQARTRGLPRLRGSGAVPAAIQAATQR
jgi:hypothetical protein